MNASEHRRTAEALLDRAQKAIGEGVPEFFVAAAQVHATLALSAPEAPAVSSTPERKPR